MFRSHCSDPRMRPISSLDTVLPIYTSLTPCYNRRSSHLVYRKPFFLTRAHLQGESSIQYISLSSSGPWLNKLQERPRSSRRITDRTVMIAKKVTVTLPVALKKSLAELPDRAKQGITNHHDLLLLPTHTEIWASVKPTRCTHGAFSSASANEKWLKGCCSGIWQVSRNSLPIKPSFPPEAENVSRDSAL